MKGSESEKERKKERTREKEGRKEGRAEIAEDGKARAGKIERGSICRATIGAR